MHMPTPSILLVDKPKGITSFDVIRELRRKLGAERGSPAWRMGHAGTLDPNATGLMIVGIGPGTKELATYLKLPKTYEAEVLFGVRTDTGDVDGKIVEEADAGTMDDAALRSAVRSVEGTHRFAVPRYSAVKIKGKPLYAYARKGRTDVEAPQKEMRVDRAEITGIVREKERVRASIRFDVGSGTYIRTLAEVIGKELGLPATLKELRRTRIGDFSIDDAVSLRDVKASDLSIQ